MNKIGLKLWSINTDAYYTEAEKLYRGGFYDYIELYVVPDSLVRLEKWKALQVPYIIHCAHSAHGFNLANKELETNNRQIYEQAKRYADELNAQYIIFHGGCDGTLEETARQLASFNEPRALIENKPMLPLPNISSAKICRGFSQEEINVVISSAHCGFCLDFGHAICAANALGKEKEAFIRNLIEQFNPKVFHLSDLESADSVVDSHYHFGRGNLDIKRITRLLPENAKVSIETNKDYPESLSDFIQDVAIFREFVNEQ